MIRVGGGYERFEDYVPKNHKQFEKNLVTHMINSDNSLDWVIKQLMAGNKIKNDILIPKPDRISSVIDSTPSERMRLPRNQFSYSPIRNSVKTGRSSVFKSPQRSKLPATIVSGRKSIEPYVR